MMDRVLGVVGRTRSEEEEGGVARRMVATVGAAERKNGKRERGREGGRGTISDKRVS